VIVRDRRPLRPSGQPGDDRSWPASPSPGDKAEGGTGASPARLPAALGQQRGSVGRLI